MSEHPNGNGQARANPPRQRPQDSYDPWLITQLNNVGERIASLESKIDAELKHVATKDDVSKSKLWVIVTAIGGMISISILIFTIMRYLDPS